MSDATGIALLCNDVCALTLKMKRKAWRWWQAKPAQADLPPGWNRSALSPPNKIMAIIIYFFFYFLECRNEPNKTVLTLVTTLHPSTQFIAPHWTLHYHIFQIEGLLDVLGYWGAAAGSSHSGSTLFVVLVVSVPQRLSLSSLPFFFLYIGITTTRKREREREKKRGKLIASEEAGGQEEAGLLETAWSGRAHDKQTSHPTFTLYSSTKTRQFKRTSETHSPCSVSFGTATRSLFTLTLRRPSSRFFLLRTYWISILCVSVICPTTQQEVTQ